jgi:hypothetical protein
MVAQQQSDHESRVRQVKSAVVRSRVQVRDATSCRGSSSPASLQHVIGEWRTSRYNLKFVDNSVVQIDFDTNASVILFPDT